MENATPLPKKFQPAPLRQREDSQNFVFIGVLAGMIALLVVMAGVYYKIKSDLAQSVKPQVEQRVATVKEVEQQTASSTNMIVTPTLIPSVTPVAISSQQDLATQQTSLDTTDISSVSAGLDANELDASQFTQ